MRRCGFKVESVEGTSVLGAAVDMTPFGFMTRGFPIPLASRDETLTFQAGVRGQQAVTLGHSKVEATYDFDYGHGAPWVLALGDVVHADSVSTVTLSDPDDLPSFSIFSETNGKEYATNGCKVEQLTTKIISGLPTAMEMDIMGWNTVAGTPLTTGEVEWPTGCDATARGWGQTHTGTFTFGSDTQGTVTEMLISATNVLDAAYGMLSPITNGIDVLEAGVYMATFRGDFRGTASDLIAAFLAATEDDFTVKFDLGTDNYHQIVLKDMILGKPKLEVQSETVTKFTVVGWASGDCIEVKLKDGFDYTSLLPA